MSKDLRLPSAEFEIGGKTRRLIANMNVLAELQEQNGGDLTGVFSGTSVYKTGLKIGAAMLNEAAEINGDDERFTPKQLGRLIPPRKAAEFAELCVGLIVKSITTDEETAPEKDNEEKN